MLQKPKPKSQKVMRYKASGSAPVGKAQAKRARVNAPVKSGVVKKLAAAGLVDLKLNSKAPTTKTPQQGIREARLRIARKMDAEGTTRRGQVLAREAYKSLAGDPL